MIAFIKGTVFQMSQSSVIIEAGGIGYTVDVPTPVLASLSLNKETLLHTYHHIKEDSQQLFGFLNDSQREFFILLNTVSGVGPKLALKIFSASSISQFTEYILSKNITALTSLPGVGKKLAEKLILELKDKIIKFSDGLVSEEGTSIIVDTGFQEDFFLALQTLGYGNDEIRSAMSKCGQDLSQASTVEDGLKLLLKHIAS
jgi:Holliday junction DNA helicase RuvA